MRWGRGRILAVANASITSKRLQGPNNYSSVGRPTVLVGGGHSPQMSRVDAMKAAVQERVSSCTVM